MTGFLNWRAAIAGLFACFVAISPAWSQSALSPEQKSEVEKTIREYLLNNPELLEEVTVELEKRRKARAEAEAKQRMVEYKTDIFQSKHDYVANADGTVPVVEFFDYQCGYCKRVLPAIQRVRSRMPDVRMVFKEFPILGPASVTAARAAIASRYQDKYLPFHDALMAHRGRLNEQVIMTVAAGVGLDVDQLKRDMAKEDVQEAIDANLALAQRMNIRGTPTMIIGDTLVPGAIAYRQMERLIDEARTNCAIC